MTRRFAYRRRAACLLPLVVMVASGAGCLQKMRWPWASTPPPPPAVLSANPSLDEIVRAVNGNSALVRSMSTDYGTLAPQGAPQLRAAIYIEKPGRFRVRGSHALAGPELDLGSNDEMLWLWVKRFQPPAFYYARHSQAASSGFRRLMPLSPQQLVEAFGIATFDPQAAHQGPFPQGEGRLAVRSTIPGPDGMLTKTTVVDARTSLVVEQQLHDAAGKLLAAVKSSNHRLDAASRAWLPHTIELTIPADNLAQPSPTGSLSMTLSVERWDVNAQLPADAFVKPEHQGFPNVDVGDPRNLPQSAIAGNATPQSGIRMASTAGPNSASPVSLGRSRYGERPSPAPHQDSAWQAVE